MELPQFIVDYIQEFPEEKQAKLYEMHEIIAEVLTEAELKFSWKMPTFYQFGNVAHYAMSKAHIGLYPGPAAVEHYQEALKGYKTSKGAIQFPLDKPLPKALIQKIVLYSLDENITRHEQKKLRK